MKVGWLALLALVSTSTAAHAQGAAESMARASASDVSRYAVRQTRPLPPSGAAWKNERAVFADGARVAWRFAQLAYQPNTGLFSSLIHYKNSTMWDVGSGLAVLY